MRVWLDRHGYRIGLALLISAAFSSIPDPALAEQWTLARNEKGIEVHTRPVPGSRVEAFRGAGLVEAEPEAILSVLRDSDRFHEWFPNCPESKLLSREGAVSFQYSVMAAPWPVDDRDNVFRSVLSRNAATGVIELLVSAAPDAHPEQPGRVRVRTARGSWRLEPKGPGKTRVIFTMHLEPGGGVPAWLANARVVATPFEALQNLRARLAR
jgi:hypothetical protein